MLDNEAIELEFISVLIYYTYMRKLEKEENMMCRNDKGRVDPKWKTQHLASLDTPCSGSYPIFLSNLSRVARQPKQSKLSGLF